MLRTFNTHEYRQFTELSGSAWIFTAHEGEGANKPFPVTVPCCWENLPGFSAYRGTGSFETHFTAGGNVRLLFKGVSHSGRVFVDEQLVGTHYNAFTPFSFVLKNLKQAEHKLRVEVDNRFSEASALHIPNDYMTYGGINRPVAVETVGDFFIESLEALPEKSNKGDWSLKLRCFVRSLSAQERELSVLVELPGIGSANGSQSVHEGLNEFRMRIDVADIVEWSPETPRLYQLKASLWTDQELPIDDLIERVGFREVKLEGRSILLNGRKLRIKGFCRHEDHPMFGCALPLNAIAQDIQIVKDLGANAIRTSHYPNDELFLDLCDEQGILVWEENHARGLSEEMMRNPNFESQAERVVEEMIPAHINHPCILIWGILNECASETVYGRECYDKQFKLIKSLDQSRPTSFASCKFKTDICFDLPDIVSYNIYPEWYVDAAAADYLADLYQWVQNETGGRGKPFLITETGAGAIYGYRTPTLAKWSEEYQAQALEHQISAVFNQEGCSGIFIWQLTDVRVSDEWFSNRPRTMNNKGIVDEYRRPKLAYDVVRRLYSAQGNYMD